MKKILFTILSIFLITSSCFGANKAIQWDTLLGGLQDDAGLPAIDWTVTVYENDGTSTTSTIWEDASKSTAAANPITLDEYGTKERYFDGVYRIVVKDADGVTIRDTDDVRIIGYVDFGGLYIDVYSTYGNSATDIQTAINETSAAGGGTLLFKNETFTIASNVVGTSNVSWKIQQGAVFNISSSYIVSPNAYVEVGNYQFIYGTGSFIFKSDVNPIQYDIWTGVSGGRTIIKNDLKIDDNLNVSGNTYLDNIKDVYITGEDTNELNNWVRRVPTYNTYDYYIPIVYGNNKFVALTASNGNVMTSIDGETWTYRQTIGNYNYSDIIYANNIFIATAIVGTNRISKSTDGETWTTKNIPEDNSWQSIAYGAGKFVTISSNGTNRIMTSTNGETWVSKNIPIDSVYQSIAYGNGRFVAPSYLGNKDTVITSTDGDSWVTSNTGLSLNIGFVDISFGNNVFVAIAYYANVTKNIMISTDGLSWTIVDTPIFKELTTIEFINNKFIIVEKDGIAESDDGITWTIYNTGNSSDSLTGIAYGAGKYVATNTNTSFLYNHHIMTSESFNKDKKIIYKDSYSNLKLQPPDGVIGGVIELTSTTINTDVYVSPEVSIGVISTAGIITEYINVNGDTELVDVNGSSFSEDTITTTTLNATYVSANSIFAGTATFAGDVVASTAGAAFSAVNPTNTAVTSVGALNRSASVADNGTFTFDITAALFAIYNYEGYDALFYAGYNSATIVKLSDADGKFEITNTDTGKTAVYKSAESRTITVKNYTNAAKTYSVNVFGKVHSATAP